MSMDAEQGMGVSASGQSADQPRIAWFNPIAGIAGDMALGALLDAGASTEAVRAVLGRIALDGFELRIEEVERGAIRATQAIVETAPGTAHRRAADVLELIDGARLAPRVASAARRVVESLAVAEARVHGVDPADVEFHEVGAVDSIVDIVGTVAALDDLDVDIVASAPLALGAGAVSSAHGSIPGPAPGTMALVAGAGVPVRGVDTTFETTTPTGAAIIAALGSRFGPIPEMVPTATGYGAGSADPPDRANVLQVVIGVATERATDPGGAIEQLVVLESNLDDVTGEVLAAAATKLFEDGARDVWITPILMKKGRPGHQLSVLCRREHAAALRRLLLVETGTLGVRTVGVERLAVERTIDTVDLDGEPLRVKRTPHRDKPESADVERIARSRRQPVRAVLAAAEALLSRASR